ncbi:MAG: ABC transporter permease [Candidatus Aminicenantes bacterium]|nr:ABC transporter permease [Candidatus Aminicenantes bacterium]
MKFHRIFAVFLRYFYIYRRSGTRILETVYWPLLDLVLWGFVTLYLSRSAKGLPQFVAFLLGALILWDILFRSQQGISVSFLEDVWARNFLNIFVSPLTTWEYLLALMLSSLLKILIAGVVLTLMAWLLFSFNIFLIGISLLPFLILLVFLGWAIGLITTAIILRFGQQAEVLAWGIALLFQPVSAVFYPVSVLPPILQAVARFMPAAHVFEGMRSVISTGAFPKRELLVALALDVVYLAAALAFFFWMFRVARKKGLLARVGE